MSGAVEFAVRAALARVLPDSASFANVLPHALSGGLNTRSYVVTVGDADRQLVVRLPLAGAPPALNDVAAEARVMRAAAAAGLAPAVVGTVPPEGVLVSEFLPAATAWTQTDAREPRNLERIAALLRRLHALDAPAARYEAAAIAARYLAALGPTAGTDARRFGASVTSTPAPASVPLSAWSDELIARAREVDRLCAGEDALCHNDLFAANVLDDAGALVLIDFEYAVRAAPLIDLAGYAAMNELAPDERRALVAAYYRDAAPPFRHEELDGAIRMLRLMAYFWALLGARHATSAAPYAELAAGLESTLHEDRS